MTSCKYVQSYPGSGVYWKQHIKKHGNDVSTVWAQLFENEQDLIDFANKFSIENNIVDSNKWANLVPESGVYGHSYTRGWKHTTEARKKISESSKGKKTKGMLGKSHSVETKQKVSNRLKGRSFSKNFKSKTWEIVSNDSSEIITNLSRWCKDHSFVYSAVHRNALLNKPYKGYLIKEVS